MMVQRSKKLLLLLFVIISILMQNTPAMAARELKYESLLQTEKHVGPLSKRLIPPSGPSMCSNSYNYYGSDCPAPPTPN